MVWFCVCALFLVMNLFCVRFECFIRCDNFFFVRLHHETLFVCPNDSTWFLKFRIVLNLQKENFSGIIALKWHQLCSILCFFVGEMRSDSEGTKKNILQQNTVILRLFTTWTLNEFNRTEWFPFAETIGIYCVRVVCVLWLPYTDKTFVDHKNLCDRSFHSLSHNAKAPGK